MSQDPQHPFDSSPTSGGVLVLRLLAAIAIIGVIIGVVWYMTN